MKAWLLRHRNQWRFLKPLWGGYRAACANFPWRWLPGSSKTFGPPRGLHARTADYVTSAMADPRDRVHPIAPASFAEFKLPRSIDGTVHWKFKKYERVEVSPLLVYALHGVRCWGDYAGALIGRDDRLLGDLTIDIWEPRRHKIFTQLKLPACRWLSGTTAVLSTAEADVNYWHWSLELLPKLDALHRAGWPIAKIDWFVVNHRDQPYQRETLDELGIPWEKVIRADARLHAECERALAVSHKAHQYSVTAAECEFLNARAARQWPAAKPTRRLYLTREGAAFRRLTNEADVRALLESFGFETFQSDRCSVAEQRRVFREAAFVVGPHGSAMTNIVYAQPGARLLEFMAPNYVDLAFWVLASHRSVEHWVIMGEGAAAPDGVDPMARQQDITVNIERVAATLRAMGI